MKKRWLCLFLVLIFCLSLAPGVTLTAGATDVSAYDALVTALDGASTDPASPTEIKLTGDITSTARLTVKSGTYVILDLNGKKIDRRLTTASENGSVILVQGRLTITDNSTGQPGQITGGFSSENSGGVYVGSGGTLDLMGGTISDNKVAGSYGGGGVYVGSGGTFTISGNATISGNSVTGSNNGYDNGGGVYVSGTFNMTGGTIANNTTTGAGGGVMIVGAFNMSGGSITGNKASRGGGVWLNYGSMTLNGGSITGNTAESQGGGITITQQTKFNLSGNPIVTGNTVTGGKPQNLWLGSAGGSSYYSDPMITVTGELSNTPPIGVSMDSSRTNKTITSGFAANNPNADPATFFTSDDSAYLVERSGSEAMLSTAPAYDLWVAGTQVTSANAGNLSVISGVTVTDGGEASFNPATNTLTLKNASIDGAADITNTIYVPDGASEFKIAFTGTNTITARNSSGYCRAVNALGADLVLSGGEEATLTIQANMSGESSENGGLRVGSLTITGGTVTVECPAEKYGPAHNPYCISLNKNAADVLKVTGGKLISKGWEPLFFGPSAFTAERVDSNTYLSGTTNIDGTGLEPYDYATNSDYSGQNYNSTYHYVEAVPNEAGGINIAFTVTPPKAGEKTHDISNSAVVSGGNDQYLVVGDLYGVSTNAVDSFQYFEGTFVADTPYYSYALIIPMGGESLPILTRDNVTITGGSFVKSEAQDDGSARVYFSITPTEVATVIDSATFTIGIPGDGASIYDPVSVSTTDTGYTIAADAFWDVADGVDTLQAGQIYNLVLPLKPDSGYVFANSVSVAVNGGAAVTVTAQEGLASWTNLSMPVTIPESTPTPPPLSTGGGGPATYPVTPPAQVDNADVTVSPKNAAAGQTVTVTVTPDEGYRADSVTVTDKNGKEIEVTDNGDGTYSFKMPASKVTVTPVIIEDEPVPLANRPFVDVPEDAWFYDAAYHCYDNGYFQGVDDTHFDPQGTMTRAMFATVLYRIAGEPAVTGENPFTDVDDGSWYTDAVVWAAGEGIIGGYGDGRFGTSDPVTREQMVTIFWRYNGQPSAESGDLSGFADADAISEWARDAFTWAVEAGIISGKGDGVLDPKGTATRAEVAQIVMNYDTMDEG